MLRRDLFNIPPLLGLLILASCSALPGTQPAASARQLTDKDAGSTVVLKVGDALEIALQGNPTTGYTWEAAPDSISLLSPQGEMQFKPDSNLIGAGGIITLRFAALKSGQGSFKLIYHRTFEPNVPPLKTFEISLVVNP